MIKYLKLPFSFDVRRMQQELHSLENEQWKLHHQTLHYQGNWSGLPLRSLDGQADNIIVSPHPNPEYKDTVFLDNCNYFRQILSSFHCPLATVRLLKLHAGAIIKEHKDIDVCFEKGEARFHIPIITNEEVEFYLEGESMHLQEGECWYMNFNLLHSLYNKSNVDRVHLVIDAEVNDWVRSVFASPEIVVKKEMEDLTNEHDAATKKMMIELFRQMNTETSNQMADALEKELTETG